MRSHRPAPPVSCSCMDKRQRLHKVRDETSRKPVPSSQRNTSSWPQAARQHSRSGCLGPPAGSRSHLRRPPRPRRLRAAAPVRARPAAQCRPPPGCARLGQGGPRRAGQPPPERGRQGRAGSPALPRTPVGSRDASGAQSRRRHRQVNSEEKSGLSPPPRFGAPSGKALGSPRDGRPRRSPSSRQVSAPQRSRPADRGPPSPAPRSAQRAAAAAPPSAPPAGPAQLTRPRRARLRGGGDATGASGRAGKGLRSSSCSREREERGDKRRRKALG